MRRKPSGATRHELEVIISLSSLPRQAGAVEAAAESAMPAGKTEAVGKGARAPHQRTGAIGAINTDIGREIVKRGVTESAATHEIEEAATAGNPEAGKEVAETAATQAASLPMSRAARRKAAADTVATAGPLPEAAVVMNAGHTHQREATTKNVHHAEAARLSTVAAVSTTGKALFQVQQHLVRAASPDHTLGAEDINGETR